MLCRFYQGRPLGQPRGCTWSAGPHCGARRVVNRPPGRDVLLRWRRCRPRRTAGYLCRQQARRSSGPARRQSGRCSTALVKKPGHPRVSEAADGLRAVRVRGPRSRRVRRIAQPGPLGLPSARCPAPAVRRVARETPGPASRRCAHAPRSHTVAPAACRQSHRHWQSIRLSAGSAVILFSPGSLITPNRPGLTWQKPAGTPWKAGRLVESVTPQLAIVSAEGQVGDLVVMDFALVKSVLNGLRDSQATLRPAPALPAQ
jgi:hypothetical protein